MNFDNDFIMNTAPDVSEAEARHRSNTNSIITFARLEEICEGDPELLDLLREMAIYCLRYAENVCQFNQVRISEHSEGKRDERHSIEDSRGRLHEATITSMNVLARECKRKGKESSWASKLSSGRAASSTLALHVAFELIRREKK